jgi:hypothetical protein
MSMQRPRSTQRSLFGAAMVLLILGLAVLAGCGGSDDKKTALPAEQVAAFNSPYCVTAREWAAHELNGGGDGAYARGGPAALKKWWSEQLAYLKTSLQQVPPDVHEAEAVNERAIRTRLTPLLEKYGFDFKRLEAEASASETAFADHPPAEFERAQEARNLYQNEFCGYGGSPPAAKVTFTKTAAAKPYCEALAAQQEGLGQVASSGFAPDAFRTYVTSDGFLDALNTQDATAPPEIAAEVKADNAWVRSRKLDLLEKYGYDYPRLLLEGSAEELAAFNYFDPAIEEQDSRVVAYAQQVCGIE